MLIKLPFDIVIWLLFFAMHAVLWVIGIPVCYFLARTGAYAERDSQFFGYRILAWKPSLAWLWGNEENGIGGPKWWDERVKGAFSWKEVFLWSAWRNPVNNLRFVPVIHPVPDPKRVRYVGNSLDPHADLLMRRSEGSSRRTPFWSYATQGVFAGFWIIWPFSATRHFRFRIGWKILGKDAVRGLVDDYRQFYFPFALQLTPWRKG